MYPDCDHRFLGVSIDGFGEECVNCGATRDVAGEITLPRWNGDMDAPHTMQDEFEYARARGWDAWRTDDEGFLVEADPANVADPYSDFDVDTGV